MKKISFENLNGLKNVPTGLTQTEVQNQRKKFGQNVVVEVSSNRLVEILKETFRDPMIWFLIGIGAVFFVIGQKSEGLTLFVAILPLTLMDAFLHWRTQASTLGLKSNLSSQVFVIRDGSEIKIESKELVPGDILKLSTGIFIPADGVIEEAHEIQIDESVLTGEAFPIQKAKCGFDPFSQTEKSEVSVDPKSLAFAGTRVLTGKGLLRIVFTGSHTSYGEIVQSVSQMPHERTPLQISIGNLVKSLIYVSAGFCVLLAGLRMYQGHGWLDALLSAATLAIAAIPEEFPVVFTFFLGVGIYRLAQKQALVRRAVSVENIGRITQICTDKTGTITKGELALTHLDPADSIKNEDVLLVSGLSCNSEGEDPVDQAILKKAQTENVTLPTAEKRFPFTEDRKRESAFTEIEGQKTIVTKGAPETILNLTQMSPEQKKLWLNKTIQWAKEGHKVLACAKKNLSHEEFKAGRELTSDFEFIGLLAFEDPPRSEVPAAIKYAFENQIKVLMLTGDHPDTAAAIGRQVRLGQGKPIVVSAEIEPEKIKPDYFKSNPDYLKSIDIVARCTPLQKLQIVVALKNSGEIVAVTGDGVNDVPALKAADIGIAMGLRGSRSAKEVSSIILGDDNFKTIIAAILEGRQLFSNLKTSFEYLLLIHIPFVLTAAALPLLGYELVFLPVHIVWLELVIHPTAILAFQAVASSKTTKSTGSFFLKSDVYRMGILGVGLAIAIGFIFVSGLHENPDLGFARAKVMIILSVWSASLVIYYTHLKTLSAKLVVLGTLLSLLLIQLPSAAPILRVVSLPGRAWVAAIMTVLIFAGTMTGFDLVLKKRKLRE
jgi:P-type Ca2+ transporter type 2C